MEIRKTLRSRVAYCNLGVFKVANASIYVINQQARELATVSGELSCLPIALTNQAACRWLRSFLGYQSINIDPINVDA